MICRCGNVDACMVCARQVTPVPTRQPASILSLGTCANLGMETGETVPCRTCAGNVEVKLFHCGVYGQCTLYKPVDLTPCCSGVRGIGGTVVPCPSFSPRQDTFKYNLPDAGIKWAYGVTTVKERLADLLPMTLRSLAGAGFDKPRLFIDGIVPSEIPSPLKAYECSTRFPRVRTVANWLLAAWELYLRNPRADRYALFQDDFVTYRNLRGYLEACPYPERGYLNLYTFPVNQRLVFSDGFQGWREATVLHRKPPVFHHGKEIQAGRGAVALVFDNKALEALLCSPHLFGKPKDATTGDRRLDGGIVTAMNQAGWREIVHNPSLTQHLGKHSSMGNTVHPQAISFRGEAFDALDMLAKKEAVGV